MESKEPIDATLKRVSENPEFAKLLKDTTQKHNLRFEDVVRSLGGLYHRAVHEYGVNIVVDGRFWEPTELLALGVVFDFHRIPFQYVDERGKAAMFPYSLCRIVR